MDSEASIATLPPDSCAPHPLFSGDEPRASETDSRKLPEHGEENMTADLTVGGEVVKEAGQGNQKKQRTFWPRGRPPFKCWNGRAHRWRSGGRGNIYHYPIWYGVEAVQFHRGTYWREKPAVLATSEFQPGAIELASEMNLLAAKPYFPHHIPLPLLSWCNVCRVDCNSPEALEAHKSGKRHKKTLQLLEKMEGLPEIDVSIKPECDFFNVALMGNIEVPARKISKKKKRKKSEPEQPRFCIPCNAACNSQASFDAHLAGKRHISRISRFLNHNTVYGLINDQNPPDQSSAQASQDALQPLNYGLISFELPQSYSILNPYLQQACEQDSSACQYGLSHS